MKTQALHPRELTFASGKYALFRIAAIAALSFFLPHSQILGGISPFAVALTACLPLRYAAITALGSAMGYLSTGIGENNILYLLILGCALGLKFIIQRTTFRNSMAGCAGISFVSFFTINVIGFFLLDFSGSDFILRICESVIACGVTCFLFLAVRALFQYTSISQYSRVELSSLAILLMISVIALCDVKLYGFNLGIILGTLLLLIAITHTNLGGSAVSGIILAIALCLYSVDFLQVGSVLLVSAFLAGLFQIAGKLGQTAVFLAAAIFSAFIVGISLDMLFYIMCMLISAGLYLAMPERLFDYFSVLSEPELQSFGLRDNIEQRLGFAAETIQDLQNSLVRVSKSLKASTRPDPAAVCNKTAASVCQSCPMRLTCWDSHYNETADAFQKLYTMLKNGIMPGEEHLQSFRQLNCCRAPQLLERMDRNYRESVNRDFSIRRTEEVRNFAVEQLSGISQMLWEVSEEISGIETQLPDDAEIIRAIFTELAAEPKSVFCTLNRFDRMEVEIYTTAGIQVDLQELRDCLSNALKRDFAAPSVSKISNKVRISFYETATYRIEFGVRQSSKQPDTVCGDSFEHFLDNKGNAYFILSDGMGSGKRAALDSTMTCGIILKLIKAGLGMESILKFVNSSIQIKSPEESLSTIDLLKIDLYTGQAEFYKAGCASSFVLMEKTIVKVETNSLPIGILQGIEFDRKELTLHAGDTILLASDGILELPEPEITSMLKHSEEISCDHLAEAVCKAAEEELTPHDDLTAMVVRILPGV